MPILLICLGLILIVFNYIALQKDGTSFKAVLNKSQQNLSEEKLELGMIRKEMAETITELQREIYSLREELSKYKSEDVKEFKIMDDIIKEDENENEYLLKGNQDVISDINFNLKKEDEGKTDKIRELIKRGLSDDEICKELSLGKGEVLLVRSLYKS
ncbi:MAG: DUF6115 domain-containing protein [Clostridium sp.]